MAVLARLAFASAALAAGAVSDEDMSQMALEADEECSGDGEACALNALQLRGAKVNSTSGDLHELLGHPSQNITYDIKKYPGFTLWLVEEFEEPIDLDLDPVWTWSDGGLTEGDVRFVKEAIQFEDGKMKIVVDYNKDKYPTESCSHAEVGHINHKKLTSGEMRTKHNMFRYGRYESRLKAPSVKPGDTHTDGNYISTMFVYRDGKFHHWREIDWEITGDNAHSVTTNVLSAEYTRSWSAKIADSRHYNLRENTRAGFHTYAIEWLPHSITWYVDGKQVRKKTGGHVPISDKSAKIMMNLWIFGHGAYFGGRHVNNNHYPMQSEYEYFHFYRWDKDANYPCDDMTTSCLTDDDRFLSGNNPCDNVEQEGTLNGKSACKAECKAQ